MVNSGEFGARSDGVTPISNRRATSDNVPNFSSIDYTYSHFLSCSISAPTMSLIFLVTLS
ncbi:MAG TPA: palindromic element RPE2 domain-containing protein [Rickettsia endosymbiont of Sericostoma sp.]|nr:palindromic element RPE2 domain-containing protein [Rickettsia endosymbiont of Sericostoma sp.]